MEFTRSQTKINEWAKAFASGDKRSADALFNYFYPLIYRYLRSRLKDEEAVVDICQNVFLKVARSIRLYNTESGNFTGWIWQIARNAFTDYLRSKKRNVESNETALGEDFDFSHIASPDETHVLEAQEDLEKVMSIVKDLPPDDQELFRLRYIAELEYDEIEKMTGRTKNALTVAMHRIRDKIKKAYERQD